MKGALARTLSGLTGVGQGGKSEHSVTAEIIGPDRSAEDISANLGQDNIQLIRRRLKRGNGKNSNIK